MSSGGVSFSSRSIYLFFVFVMFATSCRAAFISSRIGSQCIRRRPRAPLRPTIVSRIIDNHLVKSLSIEAQTYGKESHNEQLGTKEVLTRTAVRKLRVAELRNELEQRGMDTTGTRDVLLQRMLEIVGKPVTEKEESNEPSNVNVDDKPKNDSSSDLSIDPEHTFVLQICGRVAPNQGTAGAGMLIYDGDDARQVWSARQFFRKEATAAETTYYALMTGLRFARKQGIRNVIIQSSDGNFSKQIEGEHQIKKESAKKLHWVVMKLSEDFDSFKAVKISPAENVKAEKLAKAALSTKKSVGVEFLRDEIAKRKDSVQSKSESNSEPTIVKDSSVEDNPPIAAEGAYLLRVDGGARGNPGPAGAGMVLYLDEKEIWSGWKYLGKATNNAAEYTAMLLGLQQAQSMGITRLRVESDSQLIVRQLEGRYKVKSADLKWLHAASKDELKKFSSVDLHHILRGENKRADELANQAMDTQGSNSEFKEIEPSGDEIPAPVRPQEPSPTETLTATKSSSPEGTYLLQVDGGARGNPGMAGSGMVLYDPDGNEIWSGYKFLGTATNNIAEYTAMILGLQCASSMGLSSIHVESDSQLVVRQLEGKYKVKDANMKKLYAQVMNERKNFATFDVSHIMRGENKRADELANIAMDTRASSGFDEV